MMTKDEALKMAIEAFDYDLFMKYASMVLIPLGWTVMLVLFILLFLDRK